jgi:DNA replication and repair protein RecF
VGITVISGANGSGKTNLIEAVAYLATLRSMRSSPTDALIRAGAQQAIVRAEARRESRQLLIEAEINLVGRGRVHINGQALRRSRDLLGALQVTVFSPDDLMLIKGGPQGRRDYLDDLLVGMHPRHESTIAEVERVLKQRNALLKTVGSYGRPRYGADNHGDAMFTLDVWDSKLSAAGEELARSRAALCEGLQPPVSLSYERLSTGSLGPERRDLSLTYRRSWQGPLSEALRLARSEDLRRGVTTLGPHRDDLEMSIGALPARTHASQGEQRSLALALRLGGHTLVTDRFGSPPVLLLDDVFSELDEARSKALLTCLPKAQAIMTTAGAVPESADVRASFQVVDGKLI